MPATQQRQRAGEFDHTVIVDLTAGQPAVTKRQHRARFDRDSMGHIHGLVIVQEHPVAEQATGADGQIITGQVEGAAVEGKAAIVD